MANLFDKPEPAYVPPPTQPDVNAQAQQQAELNRLSLERATQADANYGFNAQFVLGRQRNKNGIYLH